VPSSVSSYFFYSIGLVCVVIVEYVECFVGHSG
jgi:hypothetical protein